ncbi:MAG: hypothetical protein U9P44_00595, partial [archaeon]|nr:hypothetical protein [archaeon]
LNELKKKFNNELKEIKPLLLLDLEKSDYFDSVTAEQAANGIQYAPKTNSLKKIREKLEKELKNMGAYHYFILWENLVHTSSAKIVSECLKLHKLNSSWNQKLSSILYSLALAHGGQNLNKTKSKEMVIHAMLAFNDTFMDTLEKDIQNCKDYKKINGMEESDLPDIKTLSKINTKLLISTSKDKKAEPGNVYVTSKNKETNKIFKELKKDNKKAENLRKYFPVEVEISPACDHAQNNWKCHRVIKGIAWPVRYKGKKQIRPNEKSPSTYTTPAVFLEDVHLGDKIIKADMYNLVFDFKRLESRTFSDLKNKECHFKLKKPLLIDIQAHFSNHANRPGITYIDNKN